MTDSPATPMALPAALPIGVCPHCGREVPTANFCGACGADLAHRSPAGARRHHAYAAFPEEPMLRMAVTSSLFPHLSRHAKSTFRAAVGSVVVVLVALAFGGVEAPAIAVSALGIPVLYLLYTYEIDDPTRANLFRAVPVVLVVGAGLGVGWGLVGGPYVNDALGETLSFSLVRPGALAAAIAVPAVGVVLMTVPAALARLRAGGLDESLDGLVLGALGALAFVAASTITELSSLLSAGQRSEQSFAGILAEVVIRGLCSPIMAAALIGLFGASLWAVWRSDAPAGRRYLGLPVVPLAAVLALEIGCGFADVARLGDPELLVVHVAALLVALTIMRVGLHYVLLHEQGTTEVGPPSVCGHCHFVVPTMHFCPHCGVARRATARGHRAAHPPVLEGGERQ
ncbi:MAG: zinc ribbon domain-containing protein [Acidimicrobiales bacterium]